MRYINLESWPRRKQFEFFSVMDYPHFSLCANVDLTRFYPVVKQRGLSFTLATIYLLARAANAIPEFRYRIRPGMVVEHEVVHPGFTLLVAEDLFSFCIVDYAKSFATFAKSAAEQIANVQQQPEVKDEPGQDNLLFMTAIPWVSFTSFMHPLHLHPVDSIPRFAWGKFFKEGECLKMPLNVQGHHALMDGVHAGKYYAEVQSYLDQPETLLGEDPSGDH